MASAAALARRDRMSLSGVWQAAGAGGEVRMQALLLAAQRRRRLRDDA